MKSPGGQREPSEDEMLNLHADVGAGDDSHKETIRRGGFFTGARMFSSLCTSNAYKIKDRIAVILTGSQRRTVLMAEAGNPIFCHPLLVPGAPNQQIWQINCMCTYRNSMRVKSSECFCYVRAPRLQRFYRHFMHVNISLCIIFLNICVRICERILYIYIYISPPVSSKDL